MLLLAVFLAGCGSSDSPTTKEETLARGDEAPAKLDRGLAAKAEGTCDQTLREIKVLSRRFLDDLSNSSGPDAIGGALVAPGIQILKRESSRLTAIEEESDVPSFETFVGLFEPIIELAELRLEAGQAGEPERAHALELLISGLQDQQGALARQLGLDACSVSFTQALGA